MSYEFPLRLVTPAFGDPLTSLIMKLDHQKQFVLGGTTPPRLFFQLKELFHLLESLGSARIEGNRTTMAELVEKKEMDTTEDEKLREIGNIEEALLFIEQTWGVNPDAFCIDHRLVRELHRLVTSNLAQGDEGDPAPGAYRTGPVRIARSEHVPPDPGDVNDLMTMLLDFINRVDPPQYDLLKIALAHHGFAWIHPFSNGNGRTARLFTYSLLLKTGFRVGGKRPAMRLLNPTAVFCADRDRYYTMLARADKGDDEGLLAWCCYVLEGLDAELGKIQKLLDYDWFRAHILDPAIMELYRRRGLSDSERDVLVYLAKNGVISNSEVRPVIGSTNVVQASRFLAKLRERKLLVPVSGSPRSYEVNIASGPLVRTILRQLDREGFLPIHDEL